MIGVGEGQEICELCGHPMPADMPPCKVRCTGLVVDYHGEVSKEQVAAIEKMVAPEFEGGDWQTVEKE